MYDDRQIKIGNAPGDSMTSHALSKIERLGTNSASEDARSTACRKNARLAVVEKIRNLSEKKRRDQFNSLINDLSRVVSVGNRKMDKSTVLKAAIAFLRNHKEVAARSQAQESQDNWKPSFVPSEEFAHLMLEALDGFIMAFAMNGTILYTSDSVASLLGHLPRDLLNTSIYDLILEDNRAEVFQLLEACSATCSQTTNTECQISFQALLRRGAFERPGTNTFEAVHISGRYRRWSQHQHQNRIRSDSREDRHKLHNGTGDSSQMAVVATARTLTPKLLRGISLGDVTKSEFTSRHTLEWKFLFLDHRAPPIIGYLPFEVLGTTGYDYYHHNDLERIAACHEALALTGEGTSCHYRFLTKGQQWIWLRTKYYITYHQWNSKPEFIVCTHTVVGYSEAWSHLRQEAVEHNHYSHIHSSTYHKDTFHSSSSANSRSTSSHYRLSPTTTGNPRNLIPRAEAIRQFSHVSMSTQPMTAVCPGSNAGFHPTLEVQVGTGSSSKVIRLLATSPNQTNIPNIEITAPTEDELSLPNHYHLIHEQSEYSESSQSLLLPESPTLENSLMMAAYQPLFAVSSHSMTDLDYGLIPSPAVFNPVQVQLHEQLMKKHRVLQETILRQQEELRLVHEQLMRSQLVTQNVKVSPVQYTAIDPSGVAFQTTAELFPDANDDNFSSTDNLHATLSSTAHIPTQQVSQLLEISSQVGFPQQHMYEADQSDVGRCLKEVRSIDLT